MVNGKPLVELRQVTKLFKEGERERVVFSHLDGVVGSGEFVAVLGRSGSGKSTLLNLISGIDLPTSGEVIVRGEVINRLTERARTLYRRRHIGFIFQFFNLIPTLTVEENLLLPLELKGTLADGDRRRAQDLLAYVGLADRAESFPDRLSGGEQQRVAVARSLVHRPTLLLADEPTGNLDEETGRHVLDLLTSLAREQGMAMVVVTHSEEVAALADRVLKVHEGRLSATMPDGVAAR